MNGELIPFFRELIDELLRRLEAGESFDNPKLNQVAAEIFGGTRSQGAYTPRDAYDALEIAVNKYLLKGTAIKIIEHGQDSFSTLRSLMDQLPTQTDRTVEQTEYQQFSTPPVLAFLASKLLALEPQDMVLEPSAGTGSLAVWAKAVGAQVFCNETNTRRRSLLESELGFRVYDVDGEIIDDVLPKEIVPSAVLMNPPFSATAGRVVRHNSKYGLNHIESALRRLRDGGRLVAIASESISFEHSTVTGWWQKISAHYNVRANLGLDGKEYRKYGTNWGVQLLVIDKTGATPGGNWQAQLSNINWGKAGTIDDAWARLQSLPARLSAYCSVNAKERARRPLFVPYVATKITGGTDHPSVIVEAVSMASVTPPNITYRPRLPHEIVTDGMLSRIQLERVIYAGQRHEQRLPTGERSGFFVGDGTGVGKGRILAGIIADNWFQGRQRALWLSVSKDLLESTRRDLNDLGIHMPLARINEYPANGEIGLARGVLFSSYSSLIASARTGEKRLDQLQRWLGTEPVILFDEAHKAKNALASGKGEPTQTGQAVIDLQDPKRNPDYRVVYSSATGATDVRNMAYMTRLGLWGPGTSFPNGFAQFLAEIDGGGVGAMEMVSRDMKSLGMYLSGSISFGVDPVSGKAVEYRERIHRLTAEQQRMYNHAAEAWRVVLQDIDSALEVTRASPRARANALQKFWGDHQRFFRQVICAFKVPSVIDEAETALRNEKSVVISLVGTGEAKTREQVARATAEGESLEDLDFSPREILAAMIERGFPTQQYQDVTDAGSKQTVQVPVYDKSGAPVNSKAALKMKQRLLDGLSALHLPENPLDQLVNHFGEWDVAELTGRSRRLVRDPQTGKTGYKKRAPEGVAMDRVNVHGMEQFQGGRCRVAIISDAGSMGISLHASNRAPNRQRRVQITLELGWSADKQMQCFGRTHRSDQAMPPEYVLLSTELAGEKRFSSTIARRLGSLGALTKGDRGAADNADWSRYNFETSEGRAALSLMYRRILGGHEIPGLENPRQVLVKIGLIKEGQSEIRKEDEFNVPRFLNRILALETNEQNAIFDYFAELFDQTVRYAKATGSFDEGVTDIDAIAIRIAKSPVVVHADRVTGAETVLYTLDVDQPSDKVTFARADEVRRANNGAFLQHREKGDFVMVLPSGQHTDPADGATFATYSVWKPSGARISYIRDQELAERYRPVQGGEAQTWWTTQYTAVPDIETQKVHIVAGAIIPLWQRLKSKAEAKLHVVRVSTEDGQRIVGVEIPRLQVGPVLRSLGLGRFPADPGKVFHGVLGEGDEVRLVGDLKLKRSRLQGEPAIELLCVDCDRFEEFRKLGLINEQIKFRQRFFVPAVEEKGIPIVAELLKRYPVDESDKGHEEPEQTSLSVEIPVSEAKVVVLEEWVLPPDESLEQAEVHSFGTEPSADSPVLELQFSIEEPVAAENSVERKNVVDEPRVVTLEFLMKQRNLMGQQRKLQGQNRKRPNIPEQGVLSW